MSAPVSLDHHAALDQLSRALAAVLASAAERGEHGTAPVDQTGAAAGGEVRDDASVSRSSD